MDNVCIRQFNCPHSSTQPGPARAISAVPRLFITLFLLVLISSCWLCLMFSNSLAQKNIMTVSSSVEYFRSIVKVQMTKSSCNMTKWQRAVWEDIMIGLFLSQICLPAVPAGETYRKTKIFTQCKICFIPSILSIWWWDRQALWLTIHYIFRWRPLHRRRQFQNNVITQWRAARGASNK